MKTNKLKLFATLALCLISFNYSYSQEDSISYTVPEYSANKIDFVKPPEGFDTTSLFNGYYCQNTSSSMVISEIDGTTYLAIKKGMTPEFFAENNLTLISEEPFLSDNAVKGVLYKTSFVIKDIEMYRYILYAGNLSKTIWINTTYPSQFEELMNEEVLRSLQTLKL